jgi:tryptophanyl-tRNA synthetase
MRILSLKDPTSKMSKSSPDVQSRILLTDDADQIRSKIRGAVTDSIPGITFDPINRPGTSNLLTILASCVGEDATEVAGQYEGKGHGHLKADVAESIEEVIKGPREEFRRIRNEAGYLARVTEEGIAKARALSEVTMQQIRVCVGLHSY